MTVNSMLVPEVKWENMGRQRVSDGCQTPITTMVGTFTLNGEAHSVTLRHRVEHENIGKICERAFEQIKNDFLSLEPGRAYRANVMNEKAPEQEDVTATQEGKSVDPREKELTTVLPFFKEIHKQVHQKESAPAPAPSGSSDPVKAEAPLLFGDVVFSYNGKLPEKKENTSGDTSIVPASSGPLGLTQPVQSSSNAHRPVQNEVQPSPWRYRAKVAAIAASVAALAAAGLVGAATLDNLVFNTGILLSRQRMSQT